MVDDLIRGTVSQPLAIVRTPGPEVLEVCAGTLRTLGRSASPVGAIAASCSLERGRTSCKAAGSSPVGHQNVSAAPLRCQGAVVAKHYAAVFQT